MERGQQRLLRLLSRHPPVRSAEADRHQAGRARARAIGTVRARGRGHVRASVMIAAATMTAATAAAPRISGGGMNTTTEAGTVTEGMVM